MNHYQTELLATMLSTSSTIEQLRVIRTLHPGEMNLAVTCSGRWREAMCSLHVNAHMREIKTPGTRWA